MSPDALSQAPPSRAAPRQLPPNRGAPSHASPSQAPIPRPPVAAPVAVAVAVRRSLLACLSISILLIPPTRSPVSAQTPNNIGTAGDDAAHVYVRRPSSSIAAMTLAVPAGARYDPDGREGTARVLGETLRRRLLRTLPAHARLVDVTVDHELLTIGVVTRPADLDAIKDMVWRTTMETEPEGPEIDSARTAVEERLAFSEEAPAELFRAAQIEQLFGAGHPWSRPVAGTAESRQRVSAETVQAHWREYVRDNEGGSSWAVVGPDEEPPAPTGGTDPLRRPTSESARQPLPAGTSSQAPRRTEVEADITATWIAVARPVSIGTPPAAAATAATNASEADGGPQSDAAAAVYRAHVEERLFQGPSSREIVAGSVEWLDLPEGRFLLIQIAVPPAATDFWVAAATTASEADRSSEPDQAALSHWRQRRVRNQILLRTAAPADLSNELARGLARLLSLGFSRDLALERTRQQGPLPSSSLRYDGAPKVDVLVGPARTFIYGPRLSSSEAP